MSDLDAEGKRSIEWVGVDVELADLQRGLPFLKRELLRLGAPPDSKLEFERDGKKVTETLKD